MIIFELQYSCPIHLLGDSLGYSQVNTLEQHKNTNYLSKKDLYVILTYVNEESSGYH